MTDKNNFYERLSRDQIAQIDWTKRCYKCGAFKKDRILRACDDCDSKEVYEKSVFKP